MVYEAETSALLETGFYKLKFQSIGAEVLPGGVFNVTLKTAGKEHFLFNLCVTQTLNGFHHTGGLCSMEGFPIFPMLYTVSQRLVGIHIPLTNLKSCVK